MSTLSRSSLSSTARPVTLLVVVVLHCGSSTPYVMLSPNATNFVALSLGARATVTLKLHDAVCCFASCAVQVTFVDPTLNRLPLAGVHEVVTGCAPPDVAGPG